jgi:CubicO group peptidase (beta-lactamase class C family)
MIRARAGLTGLAAALAFVLAASSFPQAQPLTLSALISGARETGNLPAVGGATFTSSSGTPDIAVVGLRKIGADAQVATSDLWHIGSISKSFTSTLIARFVERKHLSWTSTMKELVGERAGAFGDVTIEHLLGHRAGIPANVTPAIMGPASQGGPSVVELRRRLVTETFKGTPTGAPGTVFLYSSLGYVIAASILEERTGKSWEELIQVEVLTPLGLASAGHGSPGVLNELTQPRGHRNGMTPVEPGPFADNAPYLGPAGRLHMSLADLARWGQEHLRGGRGQDGALLKAATIARLHQAHPGGAYALGWVSEPLGDRRLTWHNGSNTMWYAILMLDPAGDRGIVLTTNGGIAASKTLDAAARAWLQAKRPVHAVPYN